MATRDYVRRGQANTQVRKQNKRNTKQQKEPTPWLRIIAAVGIIAGFAYGLYWLEFENSVDGIGQSIVADSSASSAPETTDAANNADKVKEEPRLPTLREEEWAFIDALPEYSVEVDVEEAPASDKTYIMQCGSFRTISQAESLKARIAFQGLESEVFESDGTSGRWFRVVLGPFDRKRMAEAQRHQLRRGNILGCKIW